LKHAGGQGFSQVYRIVTYSTDMANTFPLLVKNLNKWMPNHKAVWTQIGVKNLGAPTMHIEIEVDAYDPEGAAASNK
jgi:enamine deaminase RidA (YjgF/YER057c/UK114 family)